MLSNFTKNYQLSQWEAGDRVLRTDFNADNAKIDAALANLEEEKGNCRIVTGQYIGTGTYGQENARSLTFSRKPIFVCICGEYSLFALYGCSRTSCLYSGTGWIVETSWSGNKFSWYNDINAYEHLNEKGRTYQYFALLT